MDWPELYARLRRDQNDPEAWAVLQSEVKVWAHSSVGEYGWATVADLVADVCSSVVLNIHKADGAQTFKGFTYGYFQNGRRRVYAYHRVTWVPLGSFDPPANPSDDMDTDQEEMLRRCFETLPGRDRKAVELRYFHKASATTIALELGVTEVNARRIVFNGVARLRECVDRRRNERDET